MAARVYVALGSNLGDREAHLDAACRALEALCVNGRVERSPLYESEPMGPSDQSDYLNGVCAFHTTLEPEPLLTALQAVEAANGRVRPARRWTARTLDLDILLYDSHRIETDRLVVPHPGMHERAFVLRPLLDLDATVVIPGVGPAGECLSRLDESGLRRFGAL